MKTLLKSCIIVVAFSFQQSVFNQTNAQDLKFSGYLETFYSYDAGQPENHARPSFLYNFNRHNEVNLNFGYLKAGYSTERVRANLSLMSGTYTNANLAAEPGVLKNIYEANVGVKISKNKNIWIDAGVLPSHIGFESAVGKDCWALSRSIMAENSPYFETGAKITYNSDNGKLLLSGLVLNGWQRIQRLDGNNTPAVGHQITYKPNDKIILNSSSFIGNDFPDSVRKMRYFHNLYGQFQLAEKWAVIAGFDIGAQETFKKSDKYNTWYTPILMVKYAPSAKVNIDLRGEYYDDADGVLIATGTPNGFKTFGFSANVDYNITPNLIWRVESRGFSSKDEIFFEQNKPSKNNFAITTSLAVSF